MSNTTSFHNTAPSSDISVIDYNHIFNVSMSFSLITIKTALFTRSSFGWNNSWIKRMSFEFWIQSYSRYLS